jgi:hypothetical protein
MIWNLYIDTYRSTVVVSQRQATGEHYLLISVRDPDVPLEFKPGGYYFNPLLKDGGSLHPYIVNGEGNLSSIWTGKAPKKATREKAAMLERGWFELPPRQITLADIHPDLTALISNQPKLYGAISQVARSTMNLKIPEGMNIVNYEGWLAWIAAQRMALPLRLKVVFQVLQTRAQALVFSDKDKHQLMTGEEPEPIVQVRVRWYNYEVIKVLRKRVIEGVEWDLEVPLSVLKEGEAAVVTAADRKFGTAWRNVEGVLPSGVTDQVTTEEPQEKIEGPLIWFRPENSADTPYTPFGEKFVGDRPTSINDLFQIAITAT